MAPDACAQSAEGFAATARGGDDSSATAATSAEIAAVRRSWGRMAEFVTRTSAVATSDRPV
jgi:hypothetical protein